jgi:hypothetical protein
LVQALRKKRPYLVANLDQVILHQDNAPAHTSQTTQLELDLLGFKCLKHPPYSPAVIWLFLPFLVEESYSFSTDLTVV